MRMRGMECAAQPAGPLHEQTHTASELPRHGSDSSKATPAEAPPATHLPMWALAAERFAAPPHSNGHDKRYETVKAELRGLYGKVAFKHTQGSGVPRLKALAVGIRWHSY